MQALLNDPMVSLDPNAAEEMLEKMLMMNKAYLPRFFG